MIWASLPKMSLYWKVTHPKDGKQKEARPFAGKYRSATWFIVVSVMMANFTDLFIYSAIVPVAPFALPTRAGVATDDVQYWVSIMLAVFNISSIVTSLPSGWISDKLGVRRPMFVVGVMVQFTGLTLLIIGNSLVLWIVGRSLQGIACAIVLTTTLPLLLESAPPNQSGRYLGIFGVSASAALVTGPIVGGILYDRCSYVPVMALCLALNLTDFILRMLIIEKRRLLAAGAAVMVEQVDCEKSLQASCNKGLNKNNPITTVVEISDSDTESETTDDNSRTGVLSWLRRRSVVIELLCSSRMIAALYGALLYTSIQTAFDATLPLFVEDTFHWNSLGGGLIFIPLLLSDFCGPIFGWLADIYGARITCGAGFLLGIAPLVCLRFVEHNTIEHKVLLCALLATVGLGMAAVLPAVMAEIGAVIEKKGLGSMNDSGDVGAVSRAYGLFNIAYSGGCLVGPLWGGLIRDTSGWPTMGWTLAILWGSGMLSVFLWRMK